MVKFLRKGVKHRFWLSTDNERGLTDDGEVDLEVPGRRVAEIHPAPVHPLVALPQVTNGQLRRRARSERRSIAPEVRRAPQLRLAELSIPRVVAEKRRTFAVIYIRSGPTDRQTERERERERERAVRYPRNKSLNHRSGAWTTRYSSRVT